MNRIHHIYLCYFTIIDKWMQIVYYNSGRKKRIGIYEKIPATVQKFIDERGSLELIYYNNSVKLYRLS